MDVIVPTIILIGIILGWAYLAAWVGAMAEAAGRSRRLWYLLAFFFNPIPLFIILAARTSPVATEQRQPCPRCGESIPRAAKVCRFCSCNLMCH